MFKILAELIGSLIVCAALWLIGFVLMKVAIDAVVEFVLWTATVLEMEYR